jgi:hypothetical protein
MASGAPLWFALVELACDFDRKPIFVSIDL